MLLSLENIVQKYQIKITGVIHVGAHWGQEYKEYVKSGINKCVFIEPSAAAYKILKSTLGNLSDVLLFNCACGEQDGNATLYTEKRNNGMSNSLLKPKLHLDYYPEIQFIDTETVAVRALDNLPIVFSDYNLLMMDVQGAEGMVLKGAPNCLRSMDFVYTEVNTQELYEGTAFLQDLDVYLSEFLRIETKMVEGRGWGDAFYIRKTVAWNQQ